MKPQYVKRGEVILLHNKIAKSKTETTALSTRDEKVKFLVTDGRGR